MAAIDRRTSVFERVAMTPAFLPWLCFVVSACIGAASVHAQPPAGKSPAPTGFESSKHVDYELFREPPHEYRQHAWLSYNLSRSTEETLAAQVKRWAEQDVTGGFYLGMAGGNTRELSPEY